MTLVGTFILFSTLLAGFLSPAHVLPIGTPAVAQDEKVNVTGTWLFQVETAAGSGSPTFTFKQEGEKLTGRYKGLFGEADVSGTAAPPLWSDQLISVRRCPKIIVGKIAITAGRERP